MVGLDAYHHDRILLDYVRLKWTVNTRYANKNAVSRTALDVAVLLNGGDGGNRTRVRKPSTDSSTYLAMFFNLTLSTANRQADDRRVTYF